MRRVGTFIFRRPRRLSADRRARARYTLICEEPLFADATGDRQWIHVDEQRAAAGPFGTTIAHGYLTLSMLPIFLEPFLAFEGVRMQLNYGLDSVRFPHPARVGSRIRARISVASLEERANGLLLTTGCHVEIDGGDKPACVAQSLTLLVRD